MADDLCPQPITFTSHIFQFSVFLQPKKVMSFEDSKQRAWQWKKAIEGLQNRWNLFLVSTTNSLDIWHSRGTRGSLTVGCSWEIFIYWKREIQVAEPAFQGANHTPSNHPFPCGFGTQFVTRGYCAHSAFVWYDMHTTANAKCGVCWGCVHYLLIVEKVQAINENLLCEISTVAIEIPTT